MADLFVAVLTSVGMTLVVWFLLLLYFTSAPRWLIKELLRGGWRQRWLEEAGLFQQEAERKDQRQRQLERQRLQAEAELSKLEDVVDEVESLVLSRRVRKLKPEVARRFDRLRAAAFTQLDRAQKALAKRRYEVVLECADLVISAEPNNEGYLVQLRRLRDESQAESAAADAGNDRGTAAI